MGNPGARFEHQTGDPAYRDVHARAVRLNGDECTVLYVEAGMLHEDQGCPFLERAWVSEAPCREAPCGQALRMSISPHPNALPLP